MQGAKAGGLDLALFRGAISIKWGPVRGRKPDQVYSMCGKSIDRAWYNEPMPESDGSSGSPGLAIIIVNYNTRELLAGCLDSIFASRSRYPFRVLLVDNAS